MLQLVSAAPSFQAALDPVGWIIAAIIIFNLISPLFARRRARRADTGGTAAAAASPPQPAQRAPVAPTLRRSSSTLRPSAPAAEAVADTQVEQQRVRQALAAALQQQTYRKAASSGPAPAATVAYTSPPAAALPSPSLPAALDMPRMPPPADGMQLMTLESGMTAFNRLGGSGAVVQTASRPHLALITGPRAAANAFVAAAIVGPCAALRPLGHTPAGW